MCTIMLYSYFLYFLKVIVYLVKSTFKAAAEVAATEPKMEEESGAPCVPSGNGAPGPKG